MQVFAGHVEFAVYGFNLLGDMNAGGSRKLEVSNELLESDTTYRIAIDSGMSDSRSERVQPIVEQFWVVRLPVVEVKFGDVEVDRVEIRELCYERLDDVELVGEVGTTFAMPDAVVSEVIVKNVVVELEAEVVVGFGEVQRDAEHLFGFEMETVLLAAGEVDDEGSHAF